MPHPRMAKYAISNTENASASPGAACVSATPYGRAEDVRVAPIVIPKFKLCNIERQIFSADLMISPDDAALDKRPEAFNGVRMNCANDVLADGMVNGFVREPMLEPLVSGVSICAQQVNAVRHSLTDEGFQRDPSGILDDTSDDIALALDRADDCGLAGVAAPARSAALIPMPIFIAAADIGFVNLDDPDQLAEIRVLQTGPDPMRHIEGCAVGADPHDALNLQRTDAFLGCQHHVDHAKPSPQTYIRVLEDRPDQNGKAITASLGTLRALPMERSIGDGVNLVVGAARAGDALGPTARNKVRLASVVGREQSLKLRDGHLFGNLAVWSDPLPRIASNTAGNTIAKKIAGSRHSMARRFADSLDKLQPVEPA